MFTRLCEQVAADLQLQGYLCRTIGIKLRFNDFKTCGEVSEESCTPLNYPLSASLV